MAVTVPVGFRFCPTEQEIVAEFLYKKIRGLLGDCIEIMECDIYGDGDGEEWRKRLEQDQDPSAVMYFFTKLKKKGTEKGKRWDRVTKSGTWKTQRDDPIYWRRKGKGHIGSKRSFKFIPKNKQDPRMRGWIMHEFRVDGQLLQHIKDSENKDYVVCRIKKDRETKKMMKDSSSSCINNIHEEQQNCNDGNVGQMDNQQAAATTTLDDPEMWVKLQQLEKMLLDEKATTINQDGRATPTSVLQNMECGQAPLACNYYGDQHYMQQQQQKSCNDDQHHDHDDNAAAGTAVDGPEMWVKLRQLEQMLLNEKAPAVVDHDGAIAPTSVLQNMMKDSSSCIDNHEQQQQEQQQKTCNDDDHHDHDHDHAAAAKALDGPDMWVKLQQVEHMLLDEKATTVDQDGGATPTSVLQNMEFGQAPDLACNYYGDQHSMQQQMDPNPNYMEEQEAAAGQTSNYQEMMMMVDSTAADEEQLLFNNDNVYTPCLAKEDDMAAGAAYNDGQEDNTMFSLEELDILGKLLY